MDDWGQNGDVSRLSHKWLNISLHSPLPLIFSLSSICTQFSHSLFHDISTTADGQTHTSMTNSFGLHLQSLVNYKNLSILGYCEIKKYETSLIVLLRNIVLGNKNFFCGFIV